MSVTLERVAPRPAAKRRRPMRVLLITQAPGGGVGRHFLDLAEGLSAEDIEVVGIYSPRKLDRQFRDRLAADGLPAMHELSMRRAIHPLDAVDLRRLLRMIRALGPFDLVHGHSSKGGALARLAAARLQMPCVYTPHAIVTLDPTLAPWQRRFYANIERWLARRTAAIIAVSNDEATHIHDLGIDSRKVHIVPNGIDQSNLPTRAEARARLGIGEDTTVVGFVGRLTPQKAPDVMLQAFAAAFKERRDVQLVMVGSGPAEDETRRLVDQLELGRNVLLLGDVAGPPLMPAFDVFCLSSRYEAMPYVYLEALAAGLPIVSTEVGGASMSVQEGHNGLLVPPDDIQALAAALRRLVADGKLRQEFALASSAMAESFTAEHMITETLRVYEHALAGKHELARMDF